MLADRAVTRWLDSLVFDSTPKVVAVKDAVAIADNVLGCRVGATDRSTQESADGLAAGTVLEDANMNNSTREMVNNHRDPPAKWPTLWPGER